MSKNQIRVLCEKCKGCYHDSKYSNCWGCVSDKAEKAIFKCNCGNDIDDDYILCSACVSKSFQLVKEAYRQYPNYELYFSQLKGSGLYNYDIYMPAEDLKRYDGINQFTIERGYTDTITITNDHINIRTHNQLTKTDINNIVNCSLMPINVYIKVPITESKLKINWSLVASYNCQALKGWCYNAEKKQFEYKLTMFPKYIKKAASEKIDEIKEVINNPANWNAILID